VKRSEIYREAADRINGMANIRDHAFFFQAFPEIVRGDCYEDARDFVYDYTTPSEGVASAAPDVRVLFLCFMAAIAESEGE
jgi:hypothetical protein